MIIRPAYYLRQEGYVLARVCLSVCLCVSKITQKVIEDLSEIFREYREWQKLQVIQFLG